MNILESQVTDLNFLAESPRALGRTGSMTGHRQSSSADSPADQGGTKRKADGEADGEADGSNLNTDGATSHTRAKRNRYISIACNECKRRKIKCNGNSPCQRCGHLKLDCQYAANCCTNFKDSEEFRQMNAQISSLQEQVNTLFANMNALRHSQATELTLPLEVQVSNTQDANMSVLSPSNDRLMVQHPSFRGPTSSEFSLDVANNTLHRMGYHQPNESLVTQDPTPVGSPPRAMTTNGKRSADPIWDLSKEEMIRLCEVYEEEMGVMFPFLNINKLIMHGKNLYTFIAASLEIGLCDIRNPQGVRDEQSLILKMVLAISTVVEGSGPNDIGIRLFESVREKVDRRLHSEAIDVDSLPLLVLTAIYHFHCDEEVLAWRIIGQVARMTIELGLHRRDSLFKLIKDKEKRSSAIRLFWSIYVLDRRWSFGTGMPFALQDIDIDPNLPEPELPVPYLNVMIAYSRIGSKVWRSLSSYSPNLPSSSFNTEEAAYLDYQVQQWQKSIPVNLQLPSSSSPPNQQTMSRAMKRLQILLYLRANQMRILIHRPVLHSASSIHEHPSYADTVISLAKDSIQVLTHLNQTTDIYQAAQVCFNSFLISALAVIFLASCHAPVQYSALCREEFYMAINLIKGFSNKSFVSKRLWKTIKGLKEVGPKLGLSEGNVNTEIEDPHSSAALAMAGLAGHEISGLVEFWDGGAATVGMSPMNGRQMSNEMTNLFETVSGRVATNGNIADSGFGLDGGDVGTNTHGNDDELYRQLKDLF